MQMVTGRPDDTMWYRPRAAGMACYRLLMFFPQQLKALGSQPR